MIHICLMTSIIFFFYKFTNVHLYILLLSHLTFIILTKHARWLYRINLVGISQMSSSLVVFFYFYLTFILCLSYTKLQSIRAFSLLLHSWFIYICMHICCSCNRRIKHSIIDCSSFCLQFIVGKWVYGYYYTFIFLD